MRVLTTAVAGIMVFAFTADAIAASKSRKRYRTYESYQSGTQRSNTTASNGLCQRDTGIHQSQLDFRNRCDTLEFWERMNRNSGRR